ncbi:T9SS C-terminal target domain-containing protein [Flavobacterium circumlabens]|uniref:Secreted protein (Por secretion system target) n=1 Tax=Flavobacterium circumlabens TaxID=2133765 RepID=A0A4Y7U5W2_9FLAO|nr:GEVED domain-containing protein [Flavobacterium circumlabens]TCN50693.1 putative secreted protein (Por secretion system target) [Flavobacterium circumlabens]TEB41827.1 T9SS C-terminal target domain-containing protein [Flavobacterium circumlabens]
MKNIYNININRLTILLFLLAINFTYSQTYTSWITGSNSDVNATTTGGTCLMGGGTDNDDAIKWMIQKSGGGDFVVIRSTGTAGYNDYIYGLGAVNSVETILIDSRTKAGIAEIATKIRNSEALFIAGGDQATYVSYWKDTPVEDAINYLINTKKVPVGGTSAGCAIQGKYYYSAANSSVTSAQALANPYNSDMTIGANDFLNNPIMANLITDTHYNNPDRRGRQTAFIARMWKDLGTGLNAKGIGVYEKTAVCIDQNGIAKVFAPASANYAYFYQFDTSSIPETVTSGSALTWNNTGKGVRIMKIEGDTTGSTTLNLNDWTTVSGSKASYGVIKVINGTLTETLGTAPSGCPTPANLTAGSITTNSAILNWAGSATNYTVKYKANSSSTWTTLSATTTTFVNLTSLNANTGYNVEVYGNCTSGSSTAASLNFTTTSGGGGTVTYCSSKGSDVSREWIKKVAIGSISNLSNSNGGYADFSSQVANISKGTATTLTLTPGFSATRKLYWKVFIDLNNNGLFTDSGEEVYAVFSSQTLTPQITIPSSAAVASIRMRIIMSYNSITSSCGTYNYGETEDYTLNVSGGTAKFMESKSRQETNTAIVVYPNPAVDILKIDFALAEKKDIQVSIYDMNASLVKTIIAKGNLGQNNVEVNVSDLKAGQYLLYIRRGQEVIKRSKFIIAK